MDRRQVFNLSAQKRALFAKLRQEERLASASTHSIPRRRRVEPLPLSFAQQRLWFLDQLEAGNSPVYSISRTLLLQGSLDIAVFSASVHATLQKHEALRTRFAIQDGQPVQQIMPAAAITPSLVDLSELSKDEQAAQTQKLAHAEAQHPFHLAQGPLIRFHLLRLSIEQHLLLLTVHHAICDGWSFGILLQELASAYTALASGHHASREELPVQYGDFTLWQRERMQGEMLEQELRFWQHELAGAPHLLDLPTDHPRPPVQSFQGAHTSFPLAFELAQQVRHFSQQEGATLFMTLLAGFAVLLSRYSGQTDLLIGSPIANRQQRELEGLIGFFANTLVLRTDLSDAPTFRQLLARVRERCLSAYAHQDVPFEKLVEALAPERSLSFSPLFQVMFSLQNSIPTTQTLPGLTMHTPEFVGTGTARTDLMLTIIEQPEGLHAHVEYNTDLFERATIERLGQHYQYLLTNLLAQPDQPVTRLPLLSSAREQALLQTWNPLRSAPAPAGTLMDYFERQVQQRPDAIALIAGEEQMSYHWLNARANQLAHRMRQLGVGPEICVGLCLHRGLSMLIALLAILKAGGVYVPLDPALPAERLTFLVHDAHVALLLTETALRSQLPVLPTLYLNDTTSLAMESEENLAVSVTPSNLAYIMHTSGSTGSPKGVGIPHQAILRLVIDADYIQFEHEHTLLMLAPLSFDLSTFEVWGALLNGARLVIAPAHQPSLAELAHLLNEQQVTTLWLTAGLFHQMIQEQPESLATIPQVIAGGEALNLPAVRRLLSYSRTQRIINGYGPTENTTFTTSHSIYAADPERALPSSATSVPIGAPIGHTTVYVLDSALHPVPIGVVGELYTGGSGLARGYINQPALTAERFVPDPFSSQPGARLYRTGDLVRTLSDGTLEFVGRGDRQIKLRGFRIELGEIEAGLGLHPSVSQVVVLPHTFRAGDTRLIAYIVPVHQPSFSWLEVRAFLQERLPGYMLPAGVILLAALPLTANGKLDYRALPTPDEQQLGSTHQFQPPQSEMERLLAGVWEQVLGHASIGRHDHFFELGGHSLLATQVVARLRSLLHMEIPLRTLFEAPTLSSFATALTALNATGPALPPLISYPQQQQLPLSFAQQRLWFLEQLVPGRSFYNISASIHLRGPLNRTVLEQSLNEIVRRHDILRTTFPSIAGQPVQLIAPTLPVRLPVIDLHQCSQQDHAMRQLAREEVNLPFDLTQGPLIRAHLLHLNREQHILLLTMHHIVCDGWSRDIFLRELMQLYSVLLDEQTAPLPALPIQYGDFTLWQRQWLQGEMLEQQLSFWQRELAGAPHLLDLPIDHPRPPVQSFQGKRMLFTLAPDLSRQLNRFSQQEGVTLFMTLLAGFALLLSRYSGQTDLLIGSPIANRQQQELEGLIGFFANTLVLRTNLSDAPTFRQLLARVRERCLNAYAHQDVPFEKLVEALAPERSLSHSPLFQVAFLLQNANHLTLRQSNLTLQSFEIESSVTKFDLTLSMTEIGQGLQGILEYNTDIFRHTTIKRVAHHYQRLLTSLLAQPDQPVTRLPLLSPEEEQALLLTWNPPRLASAPTGTLMDYFEQQVQQRPDAIALIAGEEQMSYHWLSARANRLAHRMRQLGVGPEICVGLCLHRGPSILIALLAILKAGGVYVPLDPALPPERHAFLVHDAHVALLLTETALHSQLPALPTIYLDEDALEVDSEETPALTLDPHALAYIIYTSGSTGTPKGVGVPHQAILRLVIDADYVQLNHDHTLLMLAPLSFDASNFEVWGALLNGARLVIAPAHQPSLAELAHLLNEQQITTLWLTAGLFHQMVQEQPESLAHVPQLLAGGEALNLSEVRSLLAYSHTQRIINGYGPTENTTFTACHVIDAADPERALPASATSVPIGAPIGHTTAYVLDAALHQVPIGVIGELYTGGAGLARGYINQPALTAERFIPDPFSSQPGARLYSTGDLVRTLPDGTLEFVGRRDRQVKLRGFRIELGEIEMVLREHPVVQEAIVDTYDLVAGDKQLVAYIVAQRKLAENELRSYLQARLPTYMLPSTYVHLDSLPLTPNGKLDRSALPLPTHGPGDSFEPPQSEMERLLAGVWEQVLGRASIGRHDHFFELGGHSLLATQIIARLRSLLHREIPLRMLFEAPTLSTFAVALNTLNTAGPALPPLTAQPARSGLPLSFAQQRLWFLEQWDTHVSLYSIPVALHLTGALNTTVLEQSINEIVRQHDILRTAFPLIDGQPLQLIAPTVKIELPTVDLRSLTTAQKELEIQHMANIVASLPFDLTQAPLLRACLLQTALNDWVLLLNVHHIIYDGWSVNIFLRELAQLYPALAAGMASPLPALPIQYSDFTHWQRQWLQGEALERQLDYWQHELADAPTMLELPTDHPRPPVQSFQGAHAPFALSPGLSGALLALSRRESVTPFMLLLAGFALLLSRYSGQTDLLIGTPIANRQQREIEGLIGFFANTLVLRADLSDAPTFRQLLARVRERCLEAYAHQDVPFEKLVEALQPERNLNHSPLFQAMFSLQNAAMDRMDMGDISLQPRSLESRITKFDLSFIMLETTQGFKGSVEYSIALFEQATIQRLIGHWQRLLVAIVDNPDQCITSLSLLPDQEYQQLLYEWCGTEPASTPELCLHEFFERQVELRPEAIAAVFEDEQVTYQELDQRANQLAHYLQKQGVGPEVLIGLYLERSLLMLIGALAILKAGGVLLPLDPSYPQERLAFMLKDAHALMVLTDHELAEQLTSLAIPCIALSADGALYAQESVTRPQSAVSAVNLAYVMYTSGSTGQPKGVMVTHQAIGNRLQWGVQDTHLTAADHTLLVASLSFDIALWELFAPWLVGGRLILARPGGYQHSSYLLSLLKEQQMTVAHFVPGILQLLVEEAELSRCDSLRCVLYGGEASSGELVRRFFARLPATQLHQFYGPTEASINATCWQCEAEPLVERVSIGRPITGMRVYLLDASLQPVPVGVTGEIYIGGVGLSRGYLNRSDLTAERFVPHPFSEQPGARLYRTGDLARYQPDGKLEFVGRRDEQIKLRGYRIELGEIEAVLRTHPAIQEAVILLREDSPGEKRLVAYVVARTQLSFGEVRRYMQHHLPDYMLPAALVQLEQLPLTPNKKVDRRSLPAPDNLRPALETSYLAPQTQLEQTIATTWQEVLGIEKAGLHDNFFDLGGYSLLIIRVQHKLQAALHKEISIVDLFKHSTINALADHLSQQMPAPTKQERTEQLNNGKNRLKHLRSQARRVTGKEANNGTV